MTKLSKKSLTASQLIEFSNNLWSAFTLMDTKDDIRLLFKDLFTHTEYKMFAKRLEIARELLRLKDYLQIQEKLHVTPVTIAKMNNILAERGEGLRKAHDKLQEMEDRLLNATRQRTASFENPLNRLRKMTLLGTALKVGIEIAGTKYDKQRKKRTATNTLDL